MAEEIIEDIVLTGTKTGKEEIETTVIVEETIEITTEEIIVEIWKVVVEATDIITIIMIIEEEEEEQEEGKEEKVEGIMGIVQLGNLHDGMIRMKEEEGEAGVIKEIIEINQEKTEAPERETFIAVTKMLEAMQLEGREVTIPIYEEKQVAEEEVPAGRSRVMLVGGERLVHQVNRNLMVDQAFVQEVMETSVTIPMIRLLQVLLELLRFPKEELLRRLMDGQR
jgi:hypothetical protein